MNPRAQEGVYIMCLMSMSDVLFYSVKHLVHRQAESKLSHTGRRQHDEQKRRPSTGAAVWA